MRQPLPLTATPSHDLKALLSWPDITESEWMKTPTVSYTIYRDGTEVTDYDGSSRSCTDAGLTNRQEYTYQVALMLDGAEVQRSKAVSMAAENRLYFGEAAIDNLVYTENTEIDTLTLPAASGGDGTPVYRLTPDLPAGLSFDAAARAITGTPSEPKDETEYIYTVSDDDGDTATLTFIIEVEEDLEPTFGEEAIDSQVFIENEDVGTVNLPEATGGDGTLTYALTPDLPAGLIFDPADRSISGTPSEPQDAKEYTYTVSDADGDEASLTFTIEVEEDLEPTFGEASVEGQVFIENTDVGTVYLPAATGGDGTLTYTLTPDLAAGLSFDDALTISGIPSEPKDETEYIYTVSDDDGDTATLTFTIKVEPDLEPTFGEEAIDSQVFIENEDVGTVNLPAATGGDGTLTYTLTPDPPAGLSFDPADRSISGTPTEPKDETEYTYTVSDADGDTATLTFTIEVEPEPVTVTAAMGEEEGDDNTVNAAESEDGIVLTGTATPGATVTATYGGETLKETTAAPDTGEWSLKLPAESLPEGQVNVAVTATVPDGRSASYEYDFSMDLTPPTLTPVELVMGPTNDNTPSVVFISSEPGTLVYGGDCGSPSPSEIVTADTEATLTYPQLADGEYSGCFVAITDAAGNTGYPAVHPDFWDIVVDTRAPELESAVVAHPFGDIVLRFSEEISWFEHPDAGAFQVFVDRVQADVEVQFIAIGWHGNGHDQREVLLELSGPVPEGDEVVLVYDHNLALSPLQDHAGNLFPSGDYEVGR